MRERKTTLASDDMHTLSRVEFVADDEGADVFQAIAATIERQQARDFDADLRVWAEALESELKANGWPDWSAMVEDVGGGAWRPDPKETSEAMAERLRAGERVKLSRGEAFIGRHVEKLSHDYFRWRLRSLIERVHHEKNPSLKLCAAFALGEAQETWRARRAFRAGFEAGRKSIEGGKRGTAERKKNQVSEREARLARIDELKKRHNDNVNLACHLEAKDHLRAGDIDPDIVPKDVDRRAKANHRLWYRHRRK